MMCSTLLERCDEANVEFVRFLVVTNDGLIRGQAVNRSHLETALASGIALPELTQSFNAIGHRVKDATYDAVGAVRLVPDPATFRVLPHEPRTGAVLCDLIEYDSNTPWEGDPRAVAQRLVSNCAHDGLAPTVAVEQEFHLYRDGRDGEPTPFDPRGAYATASMHTSRPLIVEIVDSLTSQGIDVRKHHPEYTAGKHEIVVGHGSGIEPIDSAIFCRETITSVAEQEGAHATFAPYPFDGATNGCHIHLSLWDGETNVFAPTNDDTVVSQRGRYFIGGLLEHMPGLLALAAPTVNSYARLQPKKSVCAFNCWGVGNREAAVRVPEIASSNRTAGTRLEFRPADNSANPYLAVAGLLAAGRDGIERELDCGPSIDRDPGTLDAQRRTDLGIERLPQSLGEAIDAFADDPVLTAALGESLTAAYLEIKRSQWNTFVASADQWKRETFRERF